MEETEEFLVKIGVEYESGIKKDIQIVYNRNTKKKELKINENRQQTIGELFGKLQMVFFSPEDLMLIKEGPSVRRRQIDIALSQLKPSYFYDLSKYYKILAHKNNLLKEIKKKPALLQTLDVWNENLAAYAARVIGKRKRYIEEMAAIAKIKHMVISEEKEELDMQYGCMFLSAADNEKELSAVIADKYKENREKEIIMGTTFIGPHRDDIIFSINGKEAKGLASQGQQRSVVLSFKMAQLQMIKDQINEMPILLLDDVFSELDERRRRYVYDNLQGTQTFITGTEQDMMIKDIINDIKYFKIENGIIEEK
jgi:DNA replication and repair protein RecF